MPITRKEDRWLSLAKAGEVIGVSRQTVLRMAAAGEIESELSAGRTVIDRKTAERERRKREKAAGVKTA